MINQGEFTKALELIDQNPGPLAEVIRIETLRELGRFYEGIAVAEQLLHQDLEPKVRFSCNVELAYLQYRIDEFDDALQRIDECSRLLRDIRHIDSYVREYETKMNVVTGNIHWRKGQLDQAILRYSDALEEAEAESFQLHHMHAMICISNIYSAKGNYVHSQQLLRQTLDRAILLRNNKYIAYCENNLGERLRMVDQFEQALDHYMAAIKAIDDYQNSFLIGTIEGNLGICYYELGKYDTAEKYFQHAWLKLIEGQAYTGGSEVLLYLVLIQLQTAGSKVDAYIKELKGYAENNSTGVTQYHYQLAQASLYKFRGQLFEIRRAKELMENLYDNEVLHISLRKFIIIQLIEVYIILYLVDRFGIRVELEKLYSKMVSIDNHFGTTNFNLKKIMIQSKMECLIGDVEQGRKYYQQGQEYAQNISDNYKTLIPDEKTFEKMIGQIERIYGSFQKSDIETARKLSKLVVGC